MEEEEEKKKKMGPKIVGSGIGRFVTGSTANVNDEVYYEIRKK